MPKKIIKKNDLGIVLEDVSNKFGQVMESYSALTKKIERMDDKIDNLDKRLTNFQSETNSKFETVFNYLSDNDEMMRQLVGRTNNLEQRIYVLEAKIIN